MNVSVVIPTRGNVDLTPILDSLPDDWEQIVWDNGRKRCYRRLGGEKRIGVWEDVFPVADLSVYARYAGIEYARNDLILTQDDDVIVGDPQAIVDAWCDYTEDVVVANMPQEFRHDGYTDSCLVGFGACFHRDLPHRVFAKFRSGAFRPSPGWLEDPWFQRTCDVVFTTLTPRVLVDVPKTDLPYATDESRMYRQRDHVGERARMLELARMVRDA